MRKFSLFLYSAVTVFYLIGLTSGQPEHNLFVGDDYDYDASSQYDHVAFENYDFDFQVYSLDSSADLVCYNFDLDGGTDDHGGEDYCLYKSTTARNNCISCWNIDVPTSEMDSVSKLTTSVFGKVCDNCDWDTSSRFGDAVNSYAYHSCSLCSQSEVGGTGEYYYAIDPRQFVCEDDENDEFIVRGRYLDRASNNLRWVIYDEISCSSLYGSSYGCAERLDMVDDNTGTSAIPLPCAIKDGFTCSSDSQCISNNCGGENTITVSACDSDGSINYDLSLQVYDSSCGGEGILSDDFLYSFNCTDEVGSEYVCDSDFDGDSLTNPADFCKIKEYSSCISNSECWNNNGGYDCMGVSNDKVCTNGMNGKTCSNNDDFKCDSGRCDSTCQVRLADGQSCDENSDCLNGTCSGSICGGSGITTDLAVVEITPVQVIKNVDLVKGKFGIVRVTVANYGNNSANGTVTVTFDGYPLTIYSGSQSTQQIEHGQNRTFDFTFNPNSTGTKQFVANVSVN